MSSIPLISLSSIFYRQHEDHLSIDFTIIAILQVARPHAAAKSTHATAVGSRMAADPGPEFWAHVESTEVVPTSAKHHRPMKRLTEQDADVGQLQETGVVGGDRGGGDAEEVEAGEVLTYDRDAVVLHQYKMGHVCVEEWDCAASLVCINGFCNQ